MTKQEWNKIQKERTKVRANIFESLQREGMSLRKIGSIVGLSRERVRQIMNTQRARDAREASNV